jgi:plastocyanin
MNKANPILILIVIIGLVLAVGVFYFANSGNTISESEIESKSEQIIEPEPVVPEPEPVVPEPEPVVPEPEPVVPEPEPVVPEPEPVVPEPIAESRPNPALGGAVPIAPEPEPVREPEPVIECAFGQEMVADKCELVVLEGNIECLIDKGAFCAEILMIKKGTTIKWKVIDPYLGVGGDVDYHQVYEVNGLFDSGQLTEGRSWKFTFNEVGEFDYICPPHIFMIAKIIVVD